MVESPGLNPGFGLEKYEAWPNPMQSPWHVLVMVQLLILTHIKVDSLPVLFSLITSMHSHPSYTTSSPSDSHMLSKDRMWLENIKYSMYCTTDFNKISEKGVGYIGQKWEIARIFYFIQAMFYLLESFEFYLAFIDIFPTWEQPSTIVTSCKIYHATQDKRSLNGHRIEPNVISFIIDTDIKQYHELEFSPCINEPQPPSHLVNGVAEPHLVQHRLPCRQPDSLPNHVLHRNSGRKTRLLICPMPKQLVV